MTYQNNLEQLFHEHGIFFRRPKTRFQGFMVTVFSQFKWCRWFLGGKWQGVVHDAGTEHACTVWHWVDQYMEKPYLISYLEKYDW